MAKIRVSPEFMKEALFDQFKPNPCLEIVGGHWNDKYRYFVLDVIGADVPEAEWVQADFTMERRTVKFKPMLPPEDI